MAGAALLPAACDVVRRAPTEAGSAKVVEAAFFEGVYGIHWHQKVAEAYSKEHASDGIRVHLWGDPRVTDKIKPRILRGDPPDLVDVGDLPVWLLIANGKLHPFDRALDMPAVGAPDAAWRDLFISGTLETYTRQSSLRTEEQ